ncbi:MAG: hypothetical protein H8E44_00590 [Planctomycetes bacterium]|nr:hypothetical protein [Planctomycetota bacterium]
MASGSADQEGAHFDGNGTCQVLSVLFPDDFVNDLKGQRAQRVDLVWLKEVAAKCPVGEVEVHHLPVASVENVKMLALRALFGAVATKFTRRRAVARDGQFVVRRTGLVGFLFARLEVIDEPLAVGAGDVGCGARE